MKKVYEEATQEGQRAVNAAIFNRDITPVTFYEADLQGNCIGNTYYEPDGICGFAWISIRPASEKGKKDCDFVKFCRANKIGDYSDYEKAWTIWVHDYNQSMQKKEIFANAFAKVLRDNNISAYAHSRID